MIVSSSCGSGMELLVAGAPPAAEPLPEGPVEEERADEGAAEGGPAREGALEDEPRVVCAAGGPFEAVDRRGPGGSADPRAGPLCPG